MVQYNFPNRRIVSHPNATRYALHNSELSKPTSTLPIPILNTSPSAPQPSPPSRPPCLPPLLPPPPTLHTLPSHPLLLHIPPRPSLALDRTVIRNSISRLSGVVDAKQLIVLAGAKSRLPEVGVAAVVAEEVVFAHFC